LEYNPYKYSLSDTFININDGIFRGGSVILLLGNNGLPINFENILATDMIVPKFILINGENGASNFSFNDIILINMSSPDANLIQIENSNIMIRALSVIRSMHTMLIQNSEFNMKNSLFF
jgi:hypothetical protein